MAWFNTFNSRGETVGDGRRWLADDLTITGINDNRQTIIQDRAGNVLHVIDEGFNSISAGGMRWIGIHGFRRDCSVFVRERKESVLAETSGIVARDGSQILFLSPWLETQKTLSTQHGRVLASGPIMDMAVCQSAAAYIIATGIYTRRIEVVSLLTGEVIDCTLREWEGAPVLIDTPGATWLLTITQEPSILLRPIGSAQGYKFAGIHHGPDCIWLNGRFELVSNSDRGLTQRFSQDSNAPRVDLRVTPQPEPQPEPEPDPQPQPEPAMRLPDHVFATLKSVRAKYPTPLGNKGAEVLNEVAWIHRAEGYGTERKDSGNNCGCPGIPVRLGCDILRTRDRGWDVLGDAEGAGEPQQADSGPADPARFVPPVSPSNQPDPDPDPDPTDPTLERRVEAIEGILAGFGDSLRSIDARLQTLEQHPPSGGVTELRVSQMIADALAVSERFDPSKYQVRTPVRFLGTFTGTIERK